MTTGIPQPAVTREALLADQHLRILRATAELAAERGYEGLTLEAIARRAHVSYRTFYTHFRDKGHCLLALFENVIEATESAIRQRFAAGTHSRRVEFVLEALVELVVAEPLLARAVLVEAPRAAPPGVEQHQRAARALVSLFREARGLGPHGGGLDPSLEFTVAGSVLWALYQALLVGEPEALPGLLPGLSEFALRAYGSYP